MANDYKKSANDARNHSDNARSSSAEHLGQLARMQKSAVAAEKDTADRTAYRKRQKQLKTAATKRG